MSEMYVHVLLCQRRQDANSIDDVANSIERQSRRRRGYYSRIQTTGGAENLSPPAQRKKQLMWYME